MIPLSGFAKKGKRFTSFNLVFYMTFSNKIDVFESEHGFIAIKIPEYTEIAEVSVEYKGTALEKVSIVISLIAIISFIAYVIYSKRKDKLYEGKYSESKKQNI